MRQCALERTPTGSCNQTLPDHGHYSVSVKNLSHEQSAATIAGSCNASTKEVPIHAGNEDNNQIHSERIAEAIVAQQRALGGTASHAKILTDMSGLSFHGSHVTGVQNRLPIMQRPLRVRASWPQSTAAEEGRRAGRDRVEVAEKEEFYTEIMRSQNGETMRSLISSAPATSSGSSQASMEPSIKIVAIRTDLRGDWMARALEVPSHLSFETNDTEREDLASAGITCGHVISAECAHDSDEPSNACALTLAETEYEGTSSSLKLETFPGASQLQSWRRCSVSSLFD